MGADIYLDSVCKPAREAAEPLFHAAVKLRNENTDPAKGDELQAEVTKHYDAMYPEGGYFRDSYNTTSLFGAIGLSWWQLEYDDNGCLAIDKAKDLLSKIESVDITPELLENQIKQFRKDTPEGVLAYFKGKQEQLCAMLRKSIELNEPLLCSV